mgnify:CR=1 FL=1
MNQKWIPEIFYEESQDGLTKGLPFVNIPQDKAMPSALFICEVRDAEDDMKDLAIHMFANMTALKQELDEETYDKVRLALGLETLSQASEKGQKITEELTKISKQ